MSLKTISVHKVNYCKLLATIATIIDATVINNTASLFACNKWYTLKYYI